MTARISLEVNLKRFPFFVLVSEVTFTLRATAVTMAMAGHQRVTVVLTRGTSVSTVVTRT